MRTIDVEIVRSQLLNMGLEIVGSYINKKTKVYLKDPDGYLFNVTPKDVLRGGLPLKFVTSNIFTIQNIKLWCHKNNKPFKLISETYENNLINLTWKCNKNNCGEVFETNWNNVLQGSGCTYCSGQKTSLRNCLAVNNPELSKEWDTNKNGIKTPYDYRCNSNKKVWWVCSKNSNHKWQASIINRNSGSGCPCCASKMAWEGYNLLTHNPELCKEWDYEKNSKLPSEYTPYSKKYVWWKCLKCSHEWKSTVGNRNNGFGCPACCESKGEKKIRAWLTKNNFKFKEQYKIKECRNIYPLPFDFSVFNEDDTLKVLVEYDGEQHYVKTRRKAKKSSLKSIRERDEIKTNYCTRNNIRLLRIPYWEFDNIETILSSSLQTRRVG
jgi:very-short-patch-repair endonuclease